LKVVSPGGVHLYTFSFWGRLGAGETLVKTLVKTSRSGAEEPEVGGECPFGKVVLFGEGKKGGGTVVGGRVAVAS